MTARGALLGAALGLGVAMTVERVRLDAGPPGWSLHHPDVPLRLARLAGPPRLPGEGWPLDSHGVLGRDLDADRLDATVSLPVGGQLELRLGGRQPGQGVALLLSRVGQGLAAVAVADGEQTAPVGPAPPRQWLSCDGTLDVPGDTPVQAGLAFDGPGVRAWVGESETRCDVPAPLHADRVALRSGLRRVGVQRIVAGDAPAQDAPGVAWPLRIGVTALGAALGAGVVAAGRRLGFRPGRVALLLLPWLLVPLLARADLDAGLQACRIVADHPLWWAPGLPLALSGLLVGLSLQARFVHSDRPLPRLALPLAGLLAGLPLVLAAGLWGLVALPVGAALALGLGALADRLGPAADRAVCGASGLALAAGLLAAGLSPRWAAAVPLTEGAALLLGLLVWANARAASVRAFNLVSLACVLGALALSEQALTWTSTGLSLVGVSSRATTTPAPGAADDLGTAFHSFEALEHTRQFQRYPIQDYPVQPPARSAPLRVAAVGGSSTAGAYQNDDIDQFWPADLDRLLGPDVQVINQGVGGWTSLHVRRYLETRPDVVDADIVVAYLGHNDLLTESPRPYRQLYDTWAAGGSASTAVSSLLGDVRLYQLLRFSIQALVGVGSGPAVPVDDARDNLLAIADVQHQRSGHLLLVTEGLSPDPSVMEPYGRMMATLADSDPDVAWLDGAALLADPARTGLFLDDCHLSRQGHELLAQAVADELRRLAWVP